VFTSSLAGYSNEFVCCALSMVNINVSNADAAVITKMNVECCQPRVPLCSAIIVIIVIVICCNSDICSIEDRRPSGPRHGSTT